MLSITQLKYILALHRHEHFGDAAQACHVSQPTLSAQIKKAEQTLGFLVFDRGAKPVRATDRGLPFIEESQGVVAAHERLMSQARGGFEGISGELTLGIIPTLAPYVVHWFVTDFAERYPDVELRVVERSTSEIIRGLRRMRLDVGLLATPLGVDSLQERVLFYDPFYVYAGVGEELLELDEIPAASLDSDGIWLLEDGHCLRNQALAVCELGASSSPLHNVRYEAGALETLRHIIDSSSGYTLVPETFVRHLPKPRRLAQIRPFAEPVPAREVGLVHPRRTWKADLIEALEGRIKANLPRPLRHSSQSFERLPVGV